MVKAFHLYLPLALASLAAVPAFADIASANAAYNRGDYSSAAAEYRRLALTGDPVAQYNLGQAYKLGRGVPADLAIALDWYRRAAEHNPPLAEAQDAYGLMLFQSGKRQEAIPHIQRSADRGDPRAQYVLGTAYFNGDVVRKDSVKAYAYMTLASASLNLPKASEALATMQAYISPADQERGQALAREMQVSGQRQQLATLDPKSASPTPIRNEPIRNEEVPPSNTPGASYGDPGAGASEPAPANGPATVEAPPVTAPRPARLPKSVAPRMPTKAVQARSTEEPAPVAAPSGRYRVQLGAFGDQGKAQAYGEGVLARNAAFRNLKFYLVKAGAITRLQAGPLASKASAEQVCSSARAHGGACVVVNP